MAKKKQASKNKEKQPQQQSEEVDLARKYRPETLEEFKGNVSLKKSLTSMIDKNKIPHNILFYGDYGSGKTTLARILAKQLGCSKFDMMEIDTGDFSGVDTSRNIRRKMNTTPMSGPVKAYIFDEVHMLGRGGDSSKNEAQNALLKALEEPPKHTYFFLCTTDPQNLIGTIKSRCTQFKVSALSEKQIHEHVTEVAKKEGVNLPKKVALQISRDSLGIPRDAMKILMKVLWLDDEEDMFTEAKQEAERREQAISLCRLISKTNSKTKWSEYAEILKNIDEDPEQVRRVIRGYFSKVLLSGDESAAIPLDVFKTPLYSIDNRNELIRMVYECYSEITS